eukprot:747164-Hanusia_phi.AAC.9
MMLPTIQRGRRKNVIIPEGHIFILPPRVPHSPQRTADTVGLVIERVREEGEMDCLRWYKDFERCDEILFQRYFRYTRARRQRGRGRWKGRAGNGERREEGAEMRWRGKYGIAGLNSWADARILGKTLYPLSKNT